MVRNFVTPGGFVGRTVYRRSRPVPSGRVRNDVRQRHLIVVLTACAAFALSGGSAIAASVTVQAPAAAEAGKPVEIVYSGLADGAGTLDPNGPGGPDMMLRTYFERDLDACAPTSAAQRARPESKFDGTQFIQTPSPFNVTSRVQFPNPGTYRFCAYLEVGQAGDTAPPATLAEAVVQVGAAPIPCTVPKLANLSLATATSKLKTAGCALGKVSKPRKVPKKAKLVVKSQSVTPNVTLATGTKVNVVLQVKRKR